MILLLELPALSVALRSLSSSVIPTWSPARQARDPKDEQIRIKEREAKRKMKGISLQYTEEDRVFFSDVAGIGDAKAC